MLTSTARAELTAGARAVAPMLVGVIPFGLVAGATPATTGLGGGTSIGLSTIVFAGASQLAAADALADGGSALVAVIAACTINLRLLLYSASLAPHLAAVPLVFLVLLVPAISSRPAAVAAIVGGLVALFADEAGAGHLGVLFGALGGIAAGAFAEAALERRAARDDTPLPPHPGPAP